jgi:hypothetical protein
MILAKSCHDMDLLLYLTAAKPLRISSFGSLSHFRSENAPEGAPKYCLDGCPAAATCPYDVQRAYFRPSTDPAYLRQMGVIKDRLHLMELLKTSRFGRCVYHCDNNVVDHQVCSIEFEGGVTASFTMTGHNAIERRRTRIQLTDGEIAKKVMGMKCFDMRPYFIEQRLKLRNPIYSETAAYGHMGRKNEVVEKTFTSPTGKAVKRKVELFTWEKLDAVKEVKKLFGLK